jgi:integrase
MRLATRWSVRYRRYRVQSSTLADNLRILGKMYTWAWTVGGFDLDDFLISGNVLSAFQIQSLAEYFRMPKEAFLLLGASSFDHYLEVTEEFLKWALSNSNRGGHSPFTTLEQLTSAYTQIEMIFETLHIGANTSQRIEPLTNEEIAAIRKAIAPTQNDNKEWGFPENSFSKYTRLRNWVMFEVALNLGLRRGELLKLRMDCLPRGRDDGIRVLRLPDDPRDSRTREPAVKTAERILPVSRGLLHALRAYITSRPPLGRVQGKSPYLFVTRKGDPVSLDTADDIIEKIGQISGVPLSWHSLRHTWSEKKAKGSQENKGSN